MTLCNEISIFIFIVLILYYSNIVPNDISGKINQCIFWALLSMVIYNNFLSIESFRFEVSPWKTTCLNKHPHRCSGCCLPGFNGSPLNFEYTGDEERMNALASGCNVVDEATLLSNHSHDYSALGNTYDVKEGYGCAHGYDNDYKSLGGGYEKDITKSLKEGYGCAQSYQNDHQGLGSGYGGGGVTPGQPQGLLSKALGSNPLIEAYEGDCGCG